MSDKKILIVDDDPVIVKALSMKLKSKGYGVLSAADGSAAIKAVRADDPDLLIVDINFPPEDVLGGGLTWDGFSILQWLERLNKDWRKPVIIITGENAEKHMARVRESGAVAFFQKPVDTNELLAVIRRELGEEEAPAASPA